MAKHVGTFDMILEGVSEDHEINARLSLVRPGGNMTLVGAPEKPKPLSSFSLIFGNKSLSGSMIGGIPLTQEMLDFCGRHKITSDVEVIAIQQVNEAFDQAEATPGVLLCAFCGKSNVNTSGSVPVFSISTPPFASAACVMNPISG